MPSLTPRSEHRLQKRTGIAIKFKLGTTNARSHIRKEYLQEQFQALFGDIRRNKVRAATQAFYKR